MWMGSAEKRVRPECSYGLWNLLFKRIKGNAVGRDMRRTFVLVGRKKGGRGGQLRCRRTVSEGRNLLTGKEVPRQGAGAS